MTDLTKLNDDDFTVAVLKMNSPQLVETFNEMLLTTTDLGITGYAPVKRFATIDAGRRRITSLHRLIQDRLEALQKTTAPAAAPAETTAPSTETPPENVSGEEDNMAKKRKPKKAQKTGRAPSVSGETIRELTDQFNALVPAAKKAGLKVKHHTSMFESREKAKKQIAKLKKAMG